MVCAIMNQTVQPIGCTNHKLPTHTLYSHRYAQKLLESVLSLHPEAQTLCWSEAELTTLEELVEEQWRRVVVFFVLRLALAPSVEAMILLDRKLYLLEKGEG